MKPFAWSDPATLEEALTQLGPGALAKAGGVDLADRLKEGIDAPERLVNLRRIPGLDGISEGAGGLEVGALATLARVADSEPVRRRWPALAEAAARAATPNIRNQATAGGNLLQRPRCWYFRSADFHCLRKGGDTCFALDGRNAYHAVLGNDVCAIVHPSGLATALMALAARVEIAGVGGRREVALEELFVAPEEDVTREHRLAPGEIVTKIRVPAPLAGSRQAYHKVRERDSADWPIAEAAVLIELSGGRVSRASVVLGAAAPVPWRAREAEAALAGRVLDAVSAREAARAALAKATPLAENGYKVAVLEAAVQRALLAAGGAA